MRIVSLLPSATEIVCLLGLKGQLVGVSHECDYPADILPLPKVTRTLIPDDASSREIDTLVRERLKKQKALYSLDLPVLERLEPDVIVTQTLCDVCAVAEDEVRAAACSLPGTARVVNLEPMNLHGVFDSIMHVAEATGCRSEGMNVTAALRERVAAVEQRSLQVTERPRTMLLEWIDPPFCAGHWNPELVWLAGGSEVIGVPGQPSRSTSWSEVVKADPEVMVISCCGYSVEQTRADLPMLCSVDGWETLRCVQDDRVFVVDGSAYFSRPGPRLVDSLEILANVLHPQLHSLPIGLPQALRIDPSTSRAARGDCAG